MSIVKKAAILALATVTSALYLAGPAGADPGFDPCHAAVTFLCRLFPVMPDLDHDVDLTQNPDGLTGPQDTTNQPGADQNSG